MNLNVRLINVSIPEQALADVPRVSTGRSAFNGGPFYTREENERLIRSLFQREHWSIFEFQNLIYLVDAPMFVRDQLIRYRAASYNARSLRRCDPLPIIQPESEVENYYNEHSLTVYRQLIESGLKKEDARGCLPSVAPTQWIVNYNTRELFHVFDQRLTKVAQKETRTLVQRMFDEFAAVCPLLANLYLENHQV